MRAGSNRSHVNTSRQLHTSTCHSGTIQASTSEASKGRARAARERGIEGAVRAQEASGPKVHLCFRPLPCP
jgi:hypothetical protein